jgi:colanic acid/amylovoran biosynthesis glycosyltransferase
VLKNPKRYGRLFSNADLLIPISDNLKGKLITLGCDEKKLRVHRMGIRLNRFESKPHTMNKGEAVTILTIGRLVEKKGHRYSIEAFAKVAKDRNICYLIAGDGPLRGELEALVARLGVGDKVEFLGEVTQDEAIAVYNKAHIFILASVTAADGDQEGVPVVLMEAQASGIPTISTLHAGIPEVVEDGKTGYLATEKNVNAMADTLRSLIDHPEQCLMMGEKGRKLVEEKYDSDKLNHELARIYQGLLKGATKKQV